MTANAEILLKMEDKPEVDKIVALIKAMSDAEQNKILFFLQGAKFAETLAKCPTSN